MYDKGRYLRMASAFSYYKKLYFTEPETLKYEKTGGKHERKTYFR